MAEKNEFGVVYNNNYKAWYIIFRLKGDKEFKIDTKIELRPDNYDNDCVTDDFIERIKMVAQNGFEFNPYMNIAWFDEIAWF